MDTELISTRKWKDKNRTGSLKCERGGGFRSFLHSLQINSRYYYNLRNDLFLSRVLHFIIH
jgi:hypothetical protein